MSEQGGGRRDEGERTFEYKGQTWRVRFDFNMMADFEAETGLNCLDAMQELQSDTSSPSSITLRALIWASLQEYHPTVTIRQAGQMVTAGLPAFRQAAESALPEADPDAIDAPGKKKATTRRVARS